MRKRGTANGLKRLLLHRPEDSDKRRCLTGCFPKGVLWKVSEFENSELDIKIKKFLARTQIRELFSKLGLQRIEQLEKDECRHAVQHAQATKGGSMPLSVSHLFSAGQAAIPPAFHAANPRLINSRIVHPRTCSSLVLNYRASGWLRSSDSSSGKSFASLGQTVDPYAWLIDDAPLLPGVH